MNIIHTCFTSMMKVYGKGGRKKKDFVLGNTRKKTCISNLSFVHNFMAKDFIFRNSLSYPAEQSLRRDQILPSPFSPFP